MLIAHISDFHILPSPALCYGFSDTRAGLARTVTALESLEPKPDLVVATGDLVDQASVEAYQTLKAILDDLSLPLVLIPGNHDDRDLLAETFPQHGYIRGKDGLACFTRDYPAVRLVAFDAVVMGSEHAEPLEGALTWLDQTLSAEPDRSTMLVMHHPPVWTGIAFMDAIQPPHFAALEAILQDHRQVKLLLCGHVHRAVYTVLAHVRVAAAGSTGHQFSLLTELEALPTMTNEPAAIRLHLWRDGRVVSLTTPVDRGFATGRFMGMDAARWTVVRASLRSGHGRSDVAPDAVVE